MTVIRGTQTNERTQAIDTALVTYGEILQTQVPYDTALEVSSTPSVYQAGAESFITGGGAPGSVGSWRRPNYMVTEVIGVESWNPTTGQFEDRVSALYKCVSPDSGAQRVTYRVTACVRRVDATPVPETPCETGQIVKRKPGPS